MYPVEPLKTVNSLDVVALLGTLFLTPLQLNRMHGCSYESSICLCICKGNLKDIIIHFKIQCSAFDMHPQLMTPWTAALDI